MRFIAAFVIFISVDSFADCSKTFDFIRKRDFLGANMIFRGDCQNQKIKNSNLDINDRDIKISTVISNMDDCNKHYKDKNISEVKSCLYSFELKPAIELVDSLAKTKLIEDYKKWDMLVNGKKYKAEADRKAKEESEKLRLTQEESDRKKKKEEDFKSGADLVSAGCSVKAIISRSKSIIDNENEVGKISGVVNKSVLYQQGQVIVASQNRLKEISDEFQQRLGRPIDLSTCNR